MVYYEIYISDIILLISFLSLFIGSFGALMQLKIKRFLAYSTISHVGYMLLPFLSKDYTHIIPTVFYYVINYILIMLQIIIILIVICSITGNFIISKLKSLRFSAYNMSVLWFCLFWCFAFLSLAGLPPFSGFWVKIQLLKGFIYNGDNIIYSMIILLISSVSIFYYLRFMVYTYIEATIQKPWIKTHWINFNSKTSNNILYYTIFVLFMFNVFFFVYCDVFYQFLYKISYDEFFFKLNVFYKLNKD